MVSDYLGQLRDLGGRVLSLRALVNLLSVEEKGRQGLLGRRGNDFTHWAAYEYFYIYMDPPIEQALISPKLVLIETLNSLLGATCYNGNLTHKL